MTKFFLRGSLLLVVIPLTWSRGHILLEGGWSQREARSSLSGLNERQSLAQIHAIHVTSHTVQLLDVAGTSVAEWSRQQHGGGVDVRVSRWDPQVAVYVAAGADGQPGVAGIDDEGNGVVDDSAELGATGSDDPVLTPADPEYPQAQSGAITAMLLSRGAMMAVEGEAVIQGPAHLRIDWIDQRKQLSSRIVDLPAAR